MSNDIRTALDIIQDEQSIITTFVEMKNKELMMQSVLSCTTEKPCIKCRCLWCAMALPFLYNPLNERLHNDCYYKVIKEWIP